MTRPRVTLAISCGDPQGIGPEVTMAALPHALAVDPALDVVLCGDRARLLALGAAAGFAPDPRRVAFVDRPFRSELAGPPPSEEGGRAALAALRAAVELVEEGRAQALVTAPLSKEAVQRSEPGFVGHTGWLGARCGVEPLMTLASERLRVFLVTDHVPLAKVAETIDAARLERVLRQALQGLREVFGIASPRLAVLGLNPHAGEGGTLGREEEELIRPLLARLGGPGAGLHGPFSADSFFTAERLAAFDGVVAMYHDQGLIPLKALSFGAAINVSLGLPYCRTSPDHGTAYDLAGRGLARADSMARALEEARRAASR